MYKNVDEIIIKLKENGFVNFKIKVIANSKNNSIDFSEEFIKVKITSQPIDGKANKAIIEYLAKTLGVAKSHVEIVNGEKSSLKLIRVEM